MKNSFTKEDLHNNLKNIKETEDLIIKNNNIVLQTEGIDNTSRVILELQIEIAESTLKKVENLLNNIKNGK